MVKIKKSENGTWTLEISRILGIVSTLLVLSLFIWNAAMSWVVTTRIKPLEERIIIVEKAITLMQENSNRLQKEIANHCAEQSQQFGYIQGQLAILVKGK